MLMITRWDLLGVGALGAVDVATNPQSSASWENLRMLEYLTCERTHWRVWRGAHKREGRGWCDEPLSECFIGRKHGKKPFKCLDLDPSSNIGNLFGKFINWIIVLASLTWPSFSKKVLSCTAANKLVCYSNIQETRSFQNGIVVNSPFAEMPQFNDSVPENH